MIDLFDSLLKDRCSVWKKGDVTTVDAYGIVSQAFTQVAQDISCRIQPGPGKELETEAAYGIQQFLFYMRPLLVEMPPVPLTIHYWLQINLTRDLAGNIVTQTSPSAVGTMYDIKNIKNPDMLNHHLEILAELVEP
ncbi:MAG TPA: hypothetical protein VKE51_34715 [Vicinamibacterales bacterium]|nr:hypothetical protein [Vicinamibacterales bacterium]